MFLFISTVLIQCSSFNYHINKMFFFLNMVIIIMVQIKILLYLHLLPSLYHHSSLLFFFQGSI